MELKDRQSFKGRYFKCLDKGFVGLVDFMGSDECIEQAARVSYQKGTRKVSDTKNLLRYCMRHRHTSIFEQAVLKLHIKSPILVFRQFHRHRTWSYNEVSGRYSILPDECMETKPDEWRLQSTTNKQGSSGMLEEWPDDYDDSFRKSILSKFGQFNTPGELLSYREELFHKEARQLYEERLNFGIAREQARKDVPVSQYSEMFATVNLHNLFHFLKLRCDSHAQLEIRKVANICAGFVKELFPISFEAWLDYSFNSVNFTRLDRKLLDRYKILLGSDFSDEYIKEEISKEAEKIGMSNRELDEFWQKISIPDEQDFSLTNLEEINPNEEL